MDDDKTVPTGRKSRFEYVLYCELICVQDDAAVQVEENEEVFHDDDDLGKMNLDPVAATLINLYQS